jgi:hypothetical protein
MRNLFPLALALLGLTLGGCFSDSGDPSPDPETGSTGIEEKWGVDTDTSNTPDTVYAFFDPLKGLVPYPNDITGFLADPDTDGTLNIPELATQPFAAAVNELDGFSTNARLTANFSASVDSRSLSPASVFVLEVALDRSTRAVIGLSDQTIGKILASQSPFLAQGVDYDVTVATDIDAGGQTVQIKPLKPLNGNRTFNLIDPATGPTETIVENGYLAIFTNGITDTSGVPAVADTTYEQIKQGYLAGLIQIPEDPSLIDPDELTTEELLSLFIAAHLATAEALGLPVENIVVTQSFTTLDTTVVLDTATQIALQQGPLPTQLQPIQTPVDLPDPTGQIPGGVLPAGTPVTMNLLFALLGIDDPLPQANMLMYAGAMANLPYYLPLPESVNDPVVLTDWWRGSENVNPLDPTSTTLSKFNPIPKANGTVTVPLLMAVPLADPLDPTSVVVGGPLVIIGHGLQGNRLTLLALAKKWAAIGATVVAMDYPLHGIPYEEIDFENITPEELAQILAETPEALFRVPGVDERTFDLDLVTGPGIGKLPPPDGVIDTSGAHYFNFVSPLTARDNFRQSGLDLVALAVTVPTFDIAPPGQLPDGVPDYGASTIHYDGISLSGLMGTIMLGAFGENSNVATATLGVGGAVITDLVQDSFTFAPLLEGILMAQGLTPNTGIYNGYWRDTQNAFDAGDPISFAANAAALHPIHILQVEGDLVVPNSANNRLAAAMDVTEVTTEGPNDVSGNSASRVCFTEGEHGSQAGGDFPATTAEMWSETVAFGGSFGTVLPIGNVSIIGDVAEGNCQAPDRPRANVPN